MSLFVTDLDNTLIYSYKKDIGIDKILVEELNGKELSFMTSASVRLLKELRQKYTMIPLTTRSVSQFQRIHFPEDISFSYALAANGGILLIDGQVDEQWFKESKALAGEAKIQLNKGTELLLADDNVYVDIAYVDELFIFTKSKAPSQTIRILSQHLDLNLVSIHENGEKVYILPKAIHKGTAINRIRRRFAQEKIVSAGDSIFDIPMLLAADMGFYPKQLERNWNIPKCMGVCQHKTNLTRVESEIFSDGLLTILNKL